MPRRLQEHSGPDDRVAVLGSEPQIYFLSGRLSATGYIYMYPLFEPHDRALWMRGDLKREVERARPLFIVFVNSMDSRGLGPSDMWYAAEWFSSFDMGAYETVGLIEMRPGETVYRWGDEAAGDEKTLFSPPGGYWIRVLKRV